MIEKDIINKSLQAGASLAGIASVEKIRKSPSHLVYSQLDHYTGVGTPAEKQHAVSVPEYMDWPSHALSALVVALEHPEEKPELDWWDGRGTPGNRKLIQLVKDIRDWIETHLSIGTFLMHYYVQKGGVFLKDAAVLAGLGSVGRNNLLITPQYGPRVRLRALFLNANLSPTGPVTFDPCIECSVDCRAVCRKHAMAKPVKAFREISGIELPGRDGTYNRRACNTQMEADKASAEKIRQTEEITIKYCRMCEFICPVGTSGE